MKGNIGKLHLPDDPQNWVADDLDLYADCNRSASGDRFDSPYHRYLSYDGVELPDYYTQPIEGRPSHFQEAREQFKNCEWSFGSEGKPDLPSGLARFG